MTNTPEPSLRGDIQHHKEQSLNKSFEFIRKSQNDITDLVQRSNSLTHLFSNFESELKAIEGLNNSNVSVEQLSVRLKNLETRRQHIEACLGYEKKRLEAQKIHDALEGGLERIKKLASTMRTSKKKDRLVWAVNSLEHAIDKMDNTGKIMVKDSDGNKQTEGLLVDDLINTLKDLQTKQGKEVDKLNELVSQNKLIEYYHEEKRKGNIASEFDFSKGGVYKSDKEATEAWLASQIREIDTLSSYINTLQKNSKKYFDAHPDMKGNKQHWRTKLEARHIASDFRATGDTDGDYQSAMSEMNNRRELEFPDVGKEPVMADLENIANIPLVDTSDDVVGEASNTATTTIDQTPPLPPIEAGGTNMPEQRETEPVVTDIESPTSEDLRAPDTKLYVVDISKIVKRLAWTQAEEKLNDYLNRWKSKKQTETPVSQQEGGFFRKFWRGAEKTAKSIGRTMKDIEKNPKDFLASSFVRLSERGYLQKFYHEALTQIRDDKNLMAEIEARIQKSKGKEITRDKLEKHFKILDHILEEYIQEVANEEEKGDQVSDEDVNQEVSNLLYEYALGNLNSRQDLEQYVQEHIIPMMKQKGLRFYGRGEDPKNAEGLMYASNIFDIAESYKKYVDAKVQELEQKYGHEHRDQIRAHMRGIMAVDIQLGLKARDIRDTKPKGVKTWFDKRMDGAQSIPINILGKIFASPTALGAGSGVAVGLALRSMARAPLRAIMAAPAVGALFGGLFGAMRRGRDLQYDRGMELRRQALGQEADGPRSARVREYSHEMLALDDVVMRLQSLTAREQGSLKKNELQYVAQIYARLQVEQQSQVDQFSADVREGKELGTRIKSMTDMKVALRDLLRQHPKCDPAKLLILIQQEYNNLSNVVANKNTEFKSFRRKEMVKAGVFGAVAGATAGAVADAVVMSVRGHFDQSALGQLSSWMTGGKEHVASATSGHVVSTDMYHAVVPGTETSVQLPKGLIIQEKNGLLSIVDTNNNAVVADDISVHADGRLSSDTIHSLQEKGWNIVEHDGDFYKKLHMLTVPGTHTPVHLPEHLSFVEQNDIVSVVDSQTGAIVVSDIHVDSDGHLTTQTLDVLRTHGWQVSENIKHIDGGPSFSTQLHDVMIPGNPNMKIQLPDNLDMVPGSNPATFDIVDPTQGTILVSGVEFIPGTTTFTPQSGQLLKDLGWDIQDHTQTHVTVTRDSHKMLEELRQRYNNGNTPMQKRDWHRNIDPRSRHVTTPKDPFFKDKIVSDRYAYKYEATAREVQASDRSMREGILSRPVHEGQHVRGTIYDGKEQTLHAYIDKQSGDGIIDVSRGVKTMMREARGVPAFSYYDDKFHHLRSLVRGRGESDVSKRFCARFYLNLKDYKAGRAFSVPLDEHGRAHISDSTIRDALFTKKGKPRVTVEFAYEDHTKGVARILATKGARGSVKELAFSDEVMTHTLTHPTEEGVDEATYAMSTAGTEYAMIPPSEVAGVVNDHFFVPLPFVPRQAMEKGFFREEYPPINPYFYDTIFVEKERLENDPLVSPTLKENPQARLDAGYEIDRYLSVSPERKQEVEQFDAEIGEPMNEECKIAVCIPCASHMEGKNIYHTLEQYTKQKDKNGKTIDPALFEVIVFLNRPTGKEGDESEAEVVRFIQEHPEINVRVMNKQTDWGQMTSWGEQVNIGSICRRIYDLAILRATKRHGNKEVTLLMNDADLLNMSPTLIQEYIDIFDAEQNQNIDAITGDVDWGKDMHRVPQLFAMTRFWQSLERQMYMADTPMAKHTIPSWGANFAIRGSTYAAIGGRRDTPMSDLRLGNALIAARQPKYENYQNTDFPLRYSYNTWLDSNPRRYILAVYGNKLKNQNIDYDTDDLSIDRLLGPEQSVDSLNVHQLEVTLQSILSHFRLRLAFEKGNENNEDAVKHVIMSRKILENACEHVGIDYTLKEDGAFEIVSMDRFKEKLTKARAGEYFDTMPFAKQPNR